ncbi:MAG TPA: transposase [Pyrinomonadaceae bacterium]|nr:transposase [Pyrinomonadaceae bacterium]
MWNDTDIPLALLITFRAYGTWLHGDERGSVDRHNNVYGAPRIAPSEHLKFISEARLKHAPVALDARRRNAIETGVRQTCTKRGWDLGAFNIRTNHVHVVVDAKAKDPDLVLIALKANSTRCMRENGCWAHEHSPWADKGSKRRLWNERHVQAAIDYVFFGQGNDLPNFD